MLEDKEHWRFLSEVVGTEDKYYLYAPEFTVCHYSDDERDGYEYYMLNQTDPSPSWYTIEIRYFQTRIFEHPRHRPRRRQVLRARPVAFLCALGSVQPGFRSHVLLLHKGFFGLEPERVLLRRGLRRC